MSEGGCRRSVADVRSEVAGRARVSVRGFDGERNVVEVWAWPQTNPGVAVLGVACGWERVVKVGSSHWPNRLWINIVYLSYFIRKQYLSGVDKQYFISGTYVTNSLYYVKICGKWDWESRTLETVQGWGGGWFLVRLRTSLGTNGYGSK